MSRKHSGKLPPFIALFRHTVKSAAWKALSVGARATFFALKANYNTNAQNAVYLAARTGAKELGVSKTTIVKWLRELEHYGFIVKVRGARLGVGGVGKAALYRLTDCGYAGPRRPMTFRIGMANCLRPKNKIPYEKLVHPRTTERDKQRVTKIPPTIEKLP